MSEGNFNSTSSFLFSLPEYWCFFFRLALLQWDCWTHGCKNEIRTCWGVSTRMETTSTFISSISRGSSRLIYHDQAIEAPPLPEAPPAIEAPPPPAKPAWRTVHKRPDRKARTVPKITAPPSPMPPPPPEPVREMPSWTQWRRTCRIITSGNII